MWPLNDERAMKTRKAAVAAAAFALLSGIVVMQGDAGESRYLLWRAGLFPFDAKVVYAQMVSDPKRDALVVGLTVDELKERFGEVRTRQEATAEYQRYYSDRILLDEEIRWLGDSAWLVVLKNGRVTELRLMKG
jgi:hypothetical protein